MKTLPQLPEDFIKGLSGPKVKLIYKLMMAEAEVLKAEAELSAKYASYYWSINPNLKGDPKRSIFLSQVLKRFETKRQDYINLLDICSTQINGWSEAISPKYVVKNNGNVKILEENITRKHRRSLKTSRIK